MSVLDVRDLDDEQLLRNVRGINAVDRAVRNAEAATSLLAGPAPVPASVGLAMGWLVCARCGRPLMRSWRVERDGQAFHPVCMVLVLREREDVGTGPPVAGVLGPSEDAAPAEGSLPCRGAAGARSAASEPSADSKAA